MYTIITAYLGVKIEVYVLKRLKFNSAIYNNSVKMICKCFVVENPFSRT